MNTKLLEAKDCANVDPEKAMRLCNEVLNEEPDNCQALFIIGFLGLQAEKFGLAYQIFERCAAMNPTQSEIYNNMGMALEVMDGRKALKAFEKALKISHTNHHAMINLGLMNMKLGSPKKCVEWCDKALTIDPDSVAALDNKAQSLLMMRNWAEGWDLYHRSYGGKYRPRRTFNCPEWTGERTDLLVVHAEQGLGDEILFASCIEDAKKHCNALVIECDPRLQSLFERSFDVDCFGTRFERPSPINEWMDPTAYISIGELPRFFRRGEWTFPGTPYLKPDPERVAQYRALLGLSGDKLKVGIAWTGGKINTGRAERSITLDMMAPLFEHTDTCDFISLEYIEPNISTHPVKHWKRAVDKSVDHDETAALIACLDLVIAVPTTVIHTAGALGIETWCLVPDNPPSWRFHVSGEMPWHETVTLLRKSGRSWEKFIEATSERLRQWSH